MNRNTTATNRQKIAAWLQEPGNIAFVGLMAFAVALRARPMVLVYALNGADRQP